MAGKWASATIRDVAIRDHGTVSGPFGSRISKRSFVRDGVPVIRGNNLSLGTHGPRFHDDDFVFLTEEKADELASAECRPGDLVFTARGTIGQVGVIPWDARYRRYILSANQLRLRPDPMRADPLYRYYWFSSRPMVALMQSRNAGSALPNMNLGALRGLPVELPPLPQQRAIAQILAPLDDKIELNRRTSETLEAMARALFRSWFADFDPVRAKAEGRDTGLPTQVAALFPDGFEDSELGEIPAGWDVLQLGDLASIHGGKQLPAEECRPTGTFPVFGANGIMGYVERKTHDGFVIAFGRVGAYCGSVLWTYGGAWINNNASSVVPTRWPEFVLQTMLLTDFEVLRTGSAQPFIPNSSLASLRVVRPSREALDEFCAMARPLRLREQATLNESRAIAALRDALLPKLISGELRVPQAERMLEAAQV